MANEITVVRDNWMELADHFRNLPMPFQQEVFLKDCHVAGTMHVDDVLIKTADVTEGSVLSFRREPENEYDELAIAVLNAKGERIGWVPRKHNEVFARLMDAGKLLVAKVSHKELEDHWLNLRIGIYLKEM